MTDYPVSRDQIIAALQGALAGQTWARAGWLGGSDASGRTDAYSDVDVQFIVEDAYVEDAFAAIRAALEALSPIETSYRFPEPTWHGHSQAVLQLRGAGPLAVVDLVVMRLNGEADRLLEKERHGEPLVLFDKDGLLVAPTLDRVKHMAKVQARLETLRAIFPLFQGFVTKAALRGYGVETVQTYYQLTIRFLVELLRIRYCPERFDYGLRYLDRDLPAHLRAQVEDLAFPASPAQVEAYRQRAAALFDRMIEDYDRGLWRVEA